jgi:hypothetical protein
LRKVTAALATEPPLASVIVPFSCAAAAPPWARGECAQAKEIAIANTTSGPQCRFIPTPLEVMKTLYVVADKGVTPPPQNPKPFGRTAYLSIHTVLVTGPRMQKSINLLKRYRNSEKGVSPEGEKSPISERSRGPAFRHVLRQDRAAK